MENLWLPRKILGCHEKLSVAKEKNLGCYGKSLVAKEKPRLVVAMENHRLLWKNPVVWKNPDFLEKSRISKRDKK